MESLAFPSYALTLTLITTLRERIYDIEGRELEGATMRKWVQQDFLLENHLEEWLSAHLGPN